MNIFQTLKEKKIVNCLRWNLTLFNSFDYVYLFGSVLRNDTYPSDIDILLVYSVYSNKICDEIPIIKSKLEKMLRFPVDLTVLSQNELIETGFLSRIGNYILIV